jgi:glycosyltransferase involved in cell wall biosynthesis
MISAMPKRLKVLMSAYACEPGKGSEPEVGWQWALQMARFHDVTVLTRMNNRVSIDAALTALRGKQPLPQFVFHDRGRVLLSLKSRFKLVQLYYILWQRSARTLAAQMHQVQHFDLMHHVTFAAFRYPTAIWGHGVPSVWGPVGGMEASPGRLLPYGHPSSFVREVARNLHNSILATAFRILPRRAHSSTVILASTREMQRTFESSGIDASLLPTIGLNPADLPYRTHPPAHRPLRLLYVGNIISLKGLDFALDALAESRTQATLTLVGTGDYLESARRLARERGIADRVIFRGRLPREEVLRIYPDYDVFILPSLHDSGSYSTIEAMFNELPVICLDIGGPGVAVADNCGIKVSANSRSQVVADLASAIRKYEQDPDSIRIQGRAARERVLQNYDWDQKSVIMNRHYETATAKFSSSGRSPGHK